MQEAVNIALKNNLKLASLKKELQISENDIKIANRLKNPDFTSAIMLGNAALL